MNSTELATSPTRHDLSTLGRAHPTPVASLLVPPTPREEARIALRNLANDAVTLLEATGMRSVEARERMAVTERLLEDHELWAAPEVAIALFATDREAWRTRGPVMGAPRASVGPRAQLKHLLDCTPQPDYAVLALSLKSAHLYRSSNGEPIEAEKGFPVTMADVLRYDDPEPQLQHHTTGSGGPGRIPGAFHGHGGKDNRDEDVLRYLRAVAGAVVGVLTDEPLVVAATEEVAAAFRRTTGYEHVMERDIPGSGERHTTLELTEAAGEIVAQVADRHREGVRTRIEQGIGTGEAIVDLAQVVLAACEGRAAALFVAGDEGVINGVYEPEHRSVDLATDGEDLINLAAVEAWAHGGEVFVVAPDAVPGGEPAAALLRY